MPEFKQWNLVVTERAFQKRHRISGGDFLWILVRGVDFVPDVNCHVNFEVNYEVNFEVNFDVKFEVNFAANV